MSSHSTHESHKKLTRLTSFHKKNSLIHIKETGEEQRPNIPHTASGEKVSEKVYEMMESYIPKDIDSIEKQ
jgi:hypothetical protein